MSDPLTLFAEFPPVSTETWEAAIQAGLKGADYEKKLFWRTDEGFSIHPYYRKESLPANAGPLTTAGWMIAQNWQPAAHAIRADDLHEAGANAVQELGFALAAAAERLANGATAIEFDFAAGPYYFVEIAKLRAVRLLWPQLRSAFATAATMHVHVRTPQRNKSIYDRYSNLLRATTEALAATLGGCDSLDVVPFGFDAHLAPNLQRILKEEVHLDAVADPAAGSYYIEALTDELARKAWRLFQQVEAEGGFAHAQASGTIDHALAQSRAARSKAYSSRKRSLVGVNNYPDASEKTPHDEMPEPLLQTRIATPFEQLRHRTALHAAATGRFPKVLLLKRGDVKMRGARANFCFNFFGCGAFDVVESENYHDTDADLIILCSSDAEYLALAREVCPQVTVPVLVAGNPVAEIEALQNAGIRGFIHVQSDAIQTLTEWQNALGMQGHQ
jgi:methylmalonyl-CoA mutase